MNRRDFVCATGVAMTAPLLGCRLNGTGVPPASQARFTVRPTLPTGTVSKGLTSIGSVGVLDAYLFVPDQYDAAAAWPLLLALHGAGITASGPIDFLSQHATEFGFLLLAPDSRAHTWDVLVGGYGPDIAVIDRSLAWAFDHCNVDPARIFVEGFSDGASYALGMGLTNGDLFRKVIAFSPGFVPPRDPVGKPPIFISHDTRDSVLPIDSSSRVIVPLLRSEGYGVTYVEYDGERSVPLTIAQQAMRWLLPSEANR